MGKKVCVIVPCYNSADYVRKCLDNLINQTIGIENIQLILVDDASDDEGKTIGILTEYEQRYPDHIMVIALEENMRQGGARNIALSYVQSEYIAFCDSDDCLSTNALQVLYSLAITYDCDVVEFDLVNEYTGSFSKLEEEAVSFLQNNEIKATIWEMNDRSSRIEHLFRGESTNGHCNKLYRASMIKEHHITYAEHVIFEEPAFTLGVRFWAKKHLRTHLPFYLCRVRPGSTMQSDYEIHKFDNLITHETLRQNLELDGRTYEYPEETSYLFWYWFFLNTLLFAVVRNTFFTKEEIKEIQKRVLEVVPNIGSNPYFQKFWGEIPVLAEITNADLCEIDIEELRGFFKELAEVCFGS